MGDQAPLVSSPEHEVLRVSYCDHSPYVGVRRPSVVRPSVVRSHFLVYTLASTNINQSAPNMVQIYMSIRSRMSSIMELIGPELSELSALELENLPYLTVYILASTNINLSTPNLVQMYMTIRSRMSSIIEQRTNPIRTVRVICP